MREKSNPIGFKRALSRTASALFGMGALTVAVFSNAIFYGLNPAAPKPVRVIAAVQDDILTSSDAPVSLIPADVSLATIVAEVDTLKAVSADTTNASAFRDAVRERSVAGGSDWGEWAHLDSPQCKVSLNKPSAASGMSFSAVRSPEGASISIANRSVFKQKVQLSARLPHGVYSIEKISIPGNSQGNKVGVAASATQNETSNTVEIENENVKRLPGCNLTLNDFSKLQLQLEPGEIVLLRFTDTALKSRQALNDVRDRLKILSQSSPYATQKLRAILEGFDSNRVGVSATGGRKTGDRVSGIHHFLLALFQAHTLHKNFLDTKAVPQKQGVNLMESFDRLTNTLADTSINLLGLVPQIEVVPESKSSLQAASFEEGAASKPDKPCYLVTISIANQGARTATLVKLGMNSNTLPKGSVCSPEDPAIFETLSPGQTVKATCKLYWTGSAPPSQSSCVGEISYFSAGVPAHFYLSPQ